jgi:hypothetical protein
MNTVTQTIKNPDYIPRYKTVKVPRIGERKIEITEDRKIQQEWEEHQEQICLLC